MPSLEMVTMRAPSGEKKALRAPLAWPRSAQDLLAGCRVPEAHRAVTEAVTMRAPSGEKQALSTQS